MVYFIHRQPLAYSGGSFFCASEKTYGSSLFYSPLIRLVDGKNSYMVKKTIETSFFFFLLLLGSSGQEAFWVIFHLWWVSSESGPELSRWVKRVHQVHRILLTNSNLFLSMVVGVHSEGCRRVKVDIHFFIFHCFFCIIILKSSIVCIRAGIIPIWMIPKRIARLTFPSSAERITALPIYVSS